MLQPATLSFLKAVKKNNNREWFEANPDAKQVQPTQSAWEMIKDLRCPTN